MRLMLWRATGNEPVHVLCSTDHWVGDLQPLVEEPFQSGNYVEAHIGRTHFHDKAEALAAMILYREQSLQALDLQEKVLKDQIKEAKARESELEQSLEALLKLKETA